MGSTQASSVHTSHLMSDQLSVGSTQVKCIAATMRKSYWFCYLSFVSQSFITNFPFSSPFPFHFLFSFPFSFQFTFPFPFPFALQFAFSFPIFFPFAFFFLFPVLHSPFLLLFPICFTFTFLFAFPFTSHLPFLFPPPPLYFPLSNSLFLFFTHFLFPFLSYFHFLFHLLSSVQVTLLFSHFFFHLLLFSFPFFCFPLLCFSFPFSFPHYGSPLWPHPLIGACVDIHLTVCDFRLQFSDIKAKEHSVTEGWWHMEDSDANDHVWS